MPTGRTAGTARHRRHVVVVVGGAGEHVDRHLVEVDVVVAEVRVDGVAVGCTDGEVGRDDVQGGGIATDHVGYIELDRGSVGRVHRIGHVGGAIAAAVHRLAVGHRVVRGRLPYEERVAAREHLTVDVVEGAPVDDVASVAEAALERDRHLTPVGCELDVAGIDARTGAVRDLDERLVGATDVGREPARDLRRRRRENAPRRRLEADGPRVGRDELHGQERAGHGKRRRQHQ